MIPDLPTDPREALEASLTALLLGELPPDQAEFLQRTVAQDPELTKQFERLKKTIKLVRETGLGSSKELSVIAAEEPRLSDGRRQELLRRFKTVTPKSSGRWSWRETNWLVPTSVAACIVAVLGLTLMSTQKRFLSEWGRTNSAVSQLAQNQGDVLKPKQVRRLWENDAAKEKGAEMLLRRNRKGSLIETDREKAGQTEPSQTISEAVPSSTTSVQTKVALPGKAPSAPLTQSDTDATKQAWSISTGIRGFYDDSGGGGMGGIGGLASSEGKSLPAGSVDERAKLQAALRNSGDPGTQVPALQDESPPFDLSFSTRNGALSLGGDLARNEYLDSSIKQEGQNAAEQHKLPVLGDLPAAGRLFSDDSKDLRLPQTNVYAGGSYGGYSQIQMANENAPAMSLSAEALQKIDTLLAGSTQQLATGNLSESARREGHDSGSEALAEQSFPADGAFMRRYGFLSRSNGGVSKSQVRQQAEKQDVNTTIGGDSSNLVEAGKRLLERGQVEEAKNQLAEATKKDPKNQAAYYYLNLAKEAELKEILASNNVSAKSVSLASNSRDGRQQHAAVAGRANLLDKDGRLDLAAPKPATPAPIPQPEFLVRENAFSTFSLNVSDVSFKLAAASLEKGVLPEAASIRSEEFINAFDYRDPEPAPGVPIAFAWERARYPFAQNRDVLRFSIKTAASGRQASRPLNVVLLLDNSGSMERADRVAIIHEALRVLATQLQPQDTLSVVAFARTARLWVDGVPGSQAGRVAEQLSSLTPQGGTNLEEAMNLAYATALRHYLPNGINRVVLLTDGAANLGDVDPDALKRKAEANRKQGIALDCFGIGWEGYNDDLLEALARNSDGRYGFINTPDEAATEFAGQLAGALQVAASDVKVQVEFNPARVTAYRQIGYAKHQLTKEQFRDNTVNAAQIGAAESGNALYVIDCNSGGQGSIATVRVRYRVPGTSDYREQQWDVPYTGTATPLEQASPAMRLAASAGAFAEWLASSPYAAEITPDALLGYLRGVPEMYGADQRPTKLEWMLRQAKSMNGR